ncbi:MAG: putative Ig domain-containing protein [Deltaproteobacteria bacterium]|nr:putative Ig domain-containing protein [Deltaproteobacteria bacterium]
MKKQISLICLISLIFLTNCGAKIYEETLNIAVLNQNYNEHLYAVDQDLEVVERSDMVFTKTKGNLPSGIALDAEGYLTGIPTEVGNFEFQVTVYAIDNYFGSDNVTEDAEWFTLFVTEASSNAACPNPDNETSSEIFICAGSIETNDLEEGDELNVDINLHVQLSKAKKYDIEEIRFMISYDDSLFRVDENALNSLLLREAATRSEASVRFETNVSGDIIVALTAQGENFHKPGRIIDLPLVLIDTPEDGAEADFTVTILAIESGNNDADLPDFVAIDGDFSHSISD